MGRMRTSWIKQGLYFGSFMFIGMTAFDLLLFKEETAMADILYKIPVWLFVGLLYGFILEKVINKEKPQD